MNSTPMVRRADAYVAGSSGAGGTCSSRARRDDPTAIHHDGIVVPIVAIVALVAMVLVCVLPNRRAVAVLVASGLGGLAMIRASAASAISTRP